MEKALKNFAEVSRVASKQIVNLACVNLETSHVALREFKNLGNLSRLIRGCLEDVMKRLDLDWRDNAIGFRHLCTKRNNSHGEGDRAPPIGSHYGSAVRGCRRKAGDALP
jgi:hypothetical protein